MKKVCRFVMRVATPIVVSGTWMRRYLMNVLLRQRPTICIVSLGTPAKCIAMAAPDLIECVPIRSAWSPSLSSPDSIVAALSCSRIVFEETCSSSFDVVDTKAFIFGFVRPSRS